jgi:ribosomal protein S18 acetylase RimI-like enzyme
MVRMQHEPQTLERIEAGLRATASFARDVARVPGFLVAIAAGDAAGLAVAVPDGAEPDDLGGALADVEAVFGRRGLAPAIEYVEELHPTLAAGAHARGWRTDMTAPLMVVAHPDPTAPVDDRPSAVEFPGADDVTTLEAYLRGQSRAYGGHGDDGALAWMPVLRAGLAAGTIVVAALASSGRVVAGASVQIGAGVGELAGVWTLPEARRRGHASAVCAAAIARVLTPDLAFCWLSAAPDATALYQRLGFRHVGTQRNLAGPPCSSRPSA